MVQTKTGWISTTSLRSTLLHSFVIVCGLILRLWALQRGHNCDFEAFVVVAKIVDSGENVYASTTRYNYGPIWFHVLRFLFLLGARDTVAFRYWVVAFLSLVDLSIFIILYTRANRIAAYLFFLNPISIIITGYHNQFDNFALLIGMLSVIMIGDTFQESINKRKWIGLVLLGLSITVKHILFMFPFWLAVKQRGRSQKLAMIVLPLSVFLFSFLPYWQEGKTGIVQNVFLYSSFNNGYFHTFVVPSGLQTLLSSRAIWIILLLAFAFIFRTYRGFDSLLFYTCVLVATSPALANQYLAIVLPFVSLYLNQFTLAYTLAGSYFLFTDCNGLHFDEGSFGNSLSYSYIFYPTMMFLLILGFTWSIWQERIRRLYTKVCTELKAQISNE